MPRTVPYLFVLALACLCGTAGSQSALRLHPEPGYHPAPLYIEVLGGDAGAVFFTTDGSTPTMTSTRYDGRAMLVDRSAVIRVAVFRNDTLRDFAGGTYLIDEPAPELMTVSVGVDPWRLFHPRNGWFEEGDDPDRPNWDTHREHPVHVDIFETDGARVHAGTLGLRMFGGASRAHPQKSFSLSGRGDYGNKRIDYPLFGAEGPDDFRFVVLRNGGSDWGRSFLRDALLTGLLQDDSWTLDRQAARPVRVYLNGKYWGLYHLREKINPRFLEDHHPGVDKDSVDLLEHENAVKHGSGRAYEALRSFLAEADLRQSAAYARVREMMDVDNFQQLQIAQTYFDNQDAGGNIRYWRPTGGDGKFRWILYDVDQGFGLHRDAGWTQNTLERFTAADGPAWPNPPWSTLFQRRLLDNPDYRRDFVNRSVEYLSTDFSSDAVLDRIDAAVAGVEKEMRWQLARWSLRPASWRYHVDQLRRFALQRPRFLREQYRQYFRAGEDREVTVEASLGGYVELSGNLQVGTDGLTVTYFQHFPVDVRAVSEAGYRFTGWEGRSDTSAAVRLDLRDDAPRLLRATFVPLRSPAEGQVIVNELSPWNDRSGDWLELYNRGEGTVDLTGWFLEDADQHRFTLPNATLTAGGYLVVCRDLLRFTSAYPDVRDVIGGLSFGLHRERDRLGVYDAGNGFVNQVSYALDPVSDSLFTYALALPGLDNGRHRNWVRESGNGTPGRANPAHLRAAIMTRQRFWVRIGIGLAVLLVVGVVRFYRTRE